MTLAALGTRQRRKADSILTPRFIVTDDRKWTVAQQGMTAERGRARRYHRLSEGSINFLDDPHAAIEGEAQGQIIKSADGRADASHCGQPKMGAGQVPLLRPRRK
jgi:hypothetical protein